MKKLLFILALALSANAYAGEEFTLVCNLDESESESNKLYGVIPDQTWDILQIHIEEGEKLKRKGHIFSQTLTDGKAINLKVLLVEPHMIFFQTTRPMRNSTTGTVDRNTGAIYVSNHKRGGIDYSGLCEIAEE